MDSGGQLAADLTAILAAARDLDLPPSALPGWQGVCATEYAAASYRMREAVEFAMRALTDAIGTAQLGLGL